MVAALLWEILNYAENTDKSEKPSEMHVKDEEMWDYHVLVVIYSTFKIECVSECMFSFPLRKN